MKTIEQVNGKNPIVNGSVNPSLTIEEMLQFDDDKKRQMTWYMVVETKKGTPYHEIKECKFIDSLLTETYQFKMETEKSEELRKQEKETRQGREIFEAQKRLHFSGELRLTYSQLLGYVSEVGNWNGFDVVKVKRAIRKTEAIAPRKDYGINNPNTGRKSHQWSIDGDYIFLESGYCTDQNLETWKNMEKTFGDIWRDARVDSFRFEIDKVEMPGTGYPTECGIRYIMWWD